MIISLMKVFEIQTLDFDVVCDECCVDVFKSHQTPRNYSDSRLNEYVERVAQK